MDDDPERDIAAPLLSPDEREQAVRDLVQEFENDLLFTLSLGSKELFHTNLLGWLAEHHPGVGNVLLNLWTSQPAIGPLSAKREWRHLDLVLDEQTPGSPRPATRVVVENKMFALPDLAQLTEYGKVVRKLNGSPALILLSLANPGWSKRAWDDGADPTPDDDGGIWNDRAGSTWRHCSYRDLTDALKQLPDADDPYVTATLQRWIAMIDRLERLTELVGQPTPDEPFLLPQRLRQILGTARLDAPVQKLRAHQLAGMLRRELGMLRRELNDVDDLKIAAGLTNQVGLVEAFTRVSDDLEAGWQIQGNDWRMAIRVGEKHPLHGRSDSLVAARAELAARSGWADFTQPPLSQPPFTGGTEGPTNRDGSPSYGRFSPDFVYRYVRLNTITLRQAVTAGTQIIRHATETRGTAMWSSPPPTA